MYEENSQGFDERLHQVELEAREAKKAVLLTMYTGIGAVLSLLLTCILGSFPGRNSPIGISSVFMAMFVVVSVILFFSLCRKDESWYVVCSLLNHGGIGLAVLTLMAVLGLEIRPLNLAVSGLPAVAILFGVLMILICRDDKNDDDGWLYVGIIALVTMCGYALYQFFKVEQTEFWLCMAVCALLSSVNLGVLIWKRRNVLQNSIYKGLAVGSFGVYLILLVAVVVAFIFVAAGAGDSDQKSSGSRDESDGASDRNADRRPARNRFVGGNTNRFGRGAAGSLDVYGPGYMWYTAPRPRYSDTDWNETGRSEMGQTSRGNRICRLILTMILIAVVVLLIQLAIKAGRG